MAILSRWFAPAVLAVGLGVAGLAPNTAQAQSSDLTRIIVDVADVIFRSGQPYYRHGDYSDNDRLVVARDRYGRPVYYRDARYQAAYRAGPPYGNAYGYHRNRQDDDRRVKCKRMVAAR